MRSRINGAPWHRLAVSVLGVSLVLSCAPSQAVPPPTGTSSVVPSPSFPAATAVGSATPSAPAAELRSDFGVIVSFHDGSSEPALRTERDAAPLASFTGGYFRQFHGAASFDGRKLAYWHFTTDQRVPAELRVLDVAKPAEQRTVLTLRTEFPEGIVWSSDGNGLLYTITDTNSGQGVVAEYSALRSIDLVTGDMREVGRTGPRRWLIGTAWNRERAIILASETDGDTGLPVGYYRYDPSAARRINIANGLASADALRMVSVTQPADPGPFSLRARTLDDPSHDSVFDPDPDWVVLKGLSFRPGTDEVAIWRMKLQGDGLQLVLWQPSTGRTTAMFPPGIGNFRPDGSAVVSFSGEVYELATGRMARIDVPAGAFISALVRFR